MTVAEVGKELANNDALVFVEIACVVEFMNIAQVGENLHGRCHVLVNIIEVGK